VARRSTEIASAGVDDHHVAVRPVRDGPAHALAEHAVDEPGLAGPDDDQVDVALVGDRVDGRGRVADRRDVLGVDAQAVEVRAGVRELLDVARRRVDRVGR
jgi:hypothetical protein